jgi:hypothetical protein
MALASTPIERSPELEEFNCRFERLLHAGDLDGLRGVLSDDASFTVMGPEISEVWRSADDALLELEHMVADERLGRVTYALGGVTAYRCGDVGWIIGLDDTVTSGPRALVARSLTVVHRVDGEWKVVSRLMSFPLPAVLGQAIGGREG